MGTTQAVPPRRRPGEGGIEVDRARDRYRGHYRDASGKHVRLPWCSARSDAEQQLHAALEMAAATGNASGGGGITLRKWGEAFLDKRELEGHRASENDRSRWATHVATADFVDWPLVSIARKDVKRWMKELSSRKTTGRGRPNPKKPPKKEALRFLAFATKTHALNLLRRAFAVAIDDEIVDDGFANPCEGLQFKRPPTTEKPTNFFTRPELERVLAKAPREVRPLIEFAVATGLRAGEMRALRDRDVHLDVPDPYIVVRYGKPPAKPTKSGIVREVPLLPMAQRGLREWYEMRDTYCKNNDKGLTFPARYGGYRWEGKVLGRTTEKIWKKLLVDAGVQRHLVWHDLRHTCGTALRAGYFGRKWLLEEIQQFLGHADVKTTQRYAHALRETLTDAARETCGDIGGPKRSMTQ